MPEQKSDQIIAEYHDFLTGRVSSYLFELMGYIENVFDKLKGDSELSIDAHIYDQSIEELRSRKYVIESSFKLYHHSYCNQLDSQNLSDSKNIAGLHNTGADGAGNDNHPILERTIVSTRLECKQALINLSDRVSEFLKQEDVEKFNVYIDPEPILVSIWNSLGVLENKKPIYLALSHIFEPYSNYKLVNIYNDLGNSIDFSISGSSDTPLDENPLSVNGNGELIDNFVINQVKERIEKLEVEQQIRKIQTLAKARNEKAQYILGNIYYEGKYIEQDLEQASLWYRRSAEQGNNDAKYCLGNMFLVGRGISQNDEMVKYWYENADESDRYEDTTQPSGSERDHHGSTIDENIKKYFEVPDFIYQYLVNIWSQILIDIYRKQGLKSKEWKEAYDVIDDLVNWISIIDDKEVMFLQNCIYSSIVFRLKKGMNRIALDRESQLEFLSGLLEVKVKAENQIASTSSVN
ncbi:MAG: DUF1631 family protein [Gammaproteobacteria bacterium]|nr:DUF1631 family protein [Gammaproteobacteria bacterium]